MKHLFQRKLLPVVTLDNTDSALRLAEVYLELDLRVLEVTLRSEAAHSAIRAIADEFPELNIGAGTILSVDQITAAMDAGAQFGLSPGLNERVLTAARKRDFPFIPGVMSPSEVEKALEHGCEILKLFPAKVLGGADYIRSLEGPFAHTGVQFIPMGGVDTDQLQSYLSCESVCAAGGSWLASPELIRQKDFQSIAKIVRHSLELAGES